MAYKLTFKDGKVVEMEREELLEEYGIPKDWELKMVKKFLTLYESVKDIIEQDSREQKIYERLCNIKRPRPKGEFKVGDKVRIIKNNGSEYYNQFMGKIVDVIKVDSRGASIYVNMPSEDGNGNPICSQDELELVEAAK